MGSAWEEQDCCAGWDLGEGRHLTKQPTEPLPAPGCGGKPAWLVMVGARYQVWPQGAPLDILDPTQQSGALHVLDIGGTHFQGFHVTKWPP